MRFCVIHVHNDPGDPDEEAMVFVPGANKVAIAVPLSVLDRFLPTLHQATEGLDQGCPSCATPLRGARAT